MRRAWGTMSVAAAACLTAAAVAGPVPAALGAGKVPTTAVANYSMQNDTGTVMNDSAGANNGSIDAGAAAAGLDTHAATQDGFGYQWAAPTVANDARVVLVGDSSDLNPDDREFAVEAKIKTSATDGVIAQKGGSTTAGGQWRVQLQGGLVSCLFRSDTVQGAVKSKAPVNDNTWHTIRCELTSGGTAVYVDGDRVNHQNKPVTGVSNADAVTVGGKVGCGSVSTCQYYVGLVDYLTVFKGARLDNQAPSAKFTADCTANDGTCDFDATASTDPDGSIDSYEWSWTNDGTFVTSTVTPTHDFGTPGVYTVKLRVTDNEGATDSAVHTVTVLTGDPGSRPRQPAATAGDHSATVTWKPPSLDGDGPVTGYTVTSFPDGKTCTTAAGVLTCDVTGLTAGTSYTFRVRAETTVGPSANSKQTNAVTPYGKPGAPKKVTARPGDKQAKITWTAAAPHGKAVTSYVITRLPGGVKKSVDGSKRSTVFKKLKNGNTYHFTVAAVNAAGKGKATSSGKVTPIGPPTRVKGVTATGGNNAAVIKWKAAKPNGSPILHYRIDSSDGQHRVVGGKATSVKFKFLKEGKSYKFRVRAVNKGGNGAWSAWTAPVKIH
jgi:PKD repeat protein